MFQLHCERSERQSGMMLSVFLHIQIYSRVCAGEARSPLQDRNNFMRLSTFWRIPKHTHSTYLSHPWLVNVKLSCSWGKKCVSMLALCFVALSGRAVAKVPVLIGEGVTY